MSPTQYSSIMCHFNCVRSPCVTYIVSISHILVSSLIMYCQSVGKVYVTNSVSKYNVSPPPSYVSIYVHQHVSLNTASALSLESINSVSTNHLAANTVSVSRMSLCLPVMCHWIKKIMCHFTGYLHASVSQFLPTICHPIMSHEHCIYQSCVTNARFSSYMQLILYVHQPRYQKCFHKSLTFPLIKCYYVCH